MSELVMIGRSVATTSEAEPVINIEAAPMDITTVEDGNIVTEEVYSGEEINVELTDELIGDEGFVDEAVEGNMDEGMNMDPVFDEGAYIDSGMVEGDYMDPGMETGMGMVEVKDPLLSSWPFVMGISVAVLVLSIALGALLAKLKIKKGIDLYED